MKKGKIIIIISIVCFIILFMVYKIDTMNRTKNTILDISNHLLEEIQSGDYDGIRIILKNEDGSELSDEQITNFIYNTGLYRIILFNRKKQDYNYYNYSTYINFFDSGKGKINIYFDSISGEKIFNSFNFKKTGNDLYFITNQINEVNKEREKYPILIDLADGTRIEHNSVSQDKFSEIRDVYGRKRFDMEKILKIYSFVKEDDDKIYIEAIKEAKDDIKIAMYNMILNERDSLKKINEKYDIKWDNECKEFNVYYDKSLDSKIIAIEMKSCMMLSSIMVQGLNGIEDWHLTINYYDYQTEELIKTNIIR